MLYPIEENDRLGFIDASGNVVIRPQFDNVYGSFGELLAVEISDRMTYVDRTGRIVWMEKD